MKGLVRMLRMSYNCFSFVLSVSFCFFTFSIYIHCLYFHFSFLRSFIHFSNIHSFFIYSFIFLQFLQFIHYSFIHSLFIHSFIHSFIHFPKEMPFYFLSVFQEGAINKALKGFCLILSPSPYFHPEMHERTYLQC